MARVVPIRPEPTIEKDQLQRITFRTKRLLEFCSEKELTAQTAHSGDLDQPFRRIAISHSGRSRAVWRGARDGAVGHVG